MGRTKKPAVSWLQQPEETAVAFNAFRVYYEMDPEKRSQRQVAEKLHKSLTLISRWAVKNHWVERADEHDREIAQEAFKAAKAEAVKMARRHIAIGKALQSKAAQALATLQPEELEPKEILAFLREGVVMERRSQWSEIGSLEWRARPAEHEEGQNEDTGPVIITGEDEIEE